MKILATSMLAALFTLGVVGCTPIDDDDPQDGPFVGAIDAGDCEGDAYDEFMMGAEDPSPLTVDVDGSNLLVHLEDIDANCCPSPGADIDVSEGLIEIQFEDVTADDACGCMCVTDFDIEVEDVDPGSYTVDVYFNGSYLDSVEVEVV